MLDCSGRCGQPGVRAAAPAASLSLYHPVPSSWCFGAGVDEQRSDYGEHWRKVRSEPPVGFSEPVGAREGVRGLTRSCGRVGLV